MGGVPAARQALAVLTYLASRPGPVGAATIARDVGLPRSTAYHLLAELVAADYVVHLDPWWNPASEDQASDRAHRLGQTRPVTVYRLVAADTVEEKVLSLHGRKRQLAESILDGQERPTSLNAEELRGLLS